VCRGGNSAVSPCKSPVWRELREKLLTDTGSKNTASTSNLAFSNCAKHCFLSRLPSRRQPFRIGIWNQGEETPKNFVKPAVGAPAKFCGELAPTDRGRTCGDTLSAVA
jgi:hypothetical protein